MKLHKVSRYPMEVLGTGRNSHNHSFMFHNFIANFVHYHGKNVKNSYDIALLKEN